MESVKRALVVSIAARAWVALLGIVVVPLYVRLLGVEAYGLVGFFASIQALTTFLDLGLGATLIRELARLGNSTDGRRHARDITRTFETTYLLVAVLIGVMLFFLGPLLAHYWIKLDTVEPVQASRALVLGGLALALQWPAGLYGSGMAGLHKQTQLGLASSVLATIRIALTVGMLTLGTPTLETFFWSQVAGALLQSWGMRFLLWRNLDLPGHKPRIQFSILRGTMGFAGGMTGITVTSIALTQMDKLVLSHTLAMKDFGIYVLSGTLAAGLYMVISPLFSLMYPRFSALLHADNEQAVAEYFHLSSQVMAVLVIPAAIVVALFSRQIFYVWTGNVVISEQGAWVLSLLVLGNACNGIMNIPFALQLASGWTSLSFWINVAAILFLAPATWYFASKYGAIGGAAVWCGLNAGYVFVTPQFMHKRLLRTEKMAWLKRDVLAPVLVVFLVVGLLRDIDLAGFSRPGMAMVIMLFWGIAALSVLSVLPLARARVMTSIGAIITRWRMGSSRV